MPPVVSSWPERDSSQRLSIVFQDVEQRVQRFRDTLTASLKQLPMAVEEQKRLIRYLISLEVPGSPAWDAVSHNYNWLLDSVEACKQKHLSTCK